MLLTESGFVDLAIQLGQRFDENATAFALDSKLNN